PDYEVDNPAVAQKVPLLVTDADASQFSAIVDSIDGKNLVIQGPPGTGKSQTITNLIAAALAKGKKVLFMAEKKAALEVVYNRLSNAGLANYCLEGHSTATSKQTFYEQLKKRVEQTPPLDVSEELAIQIKECCQLKEQLSRYVLLLNQPFGKTGKTIQELFWISQRTNDLINQLSLPSNLAVLRDEKALEMTDGDFERKRQNLKEFRQHHKSFSQKYGHIESHPWFGMTTYDLSPIDQDDLCANGREWARVLGQLQSCCKQIEGALGLQFQTTLLELQKLKQQLESCPELTSMVDQELLSRLKDSRLQDSANLLAKQITGYRDAENCIRKVFKSGTVALPDSAQLKNILLSLESVNIDDQKYSIDELKILGQQAAEICKNIERYSPVVSQIAAFFDITDYSLSPNNIEAIATAIQVLNNNLS
ncbi:MAG TPA: AAA domain-containing protein, partial [Phormidium sp.]